MSLDNRTNQQEQYAKLTGQPFKLTNTKKGQATMATDIYSESFDNWVHDSIEAELYGSSDE